VSDSASLLWRVHAYGHYDENDWWFLTYRGYAHAENGNVR